VLKGARPVTVTLEEPQYDAVERLAAEGGVSLASIVREAVEAYTTRRKR
jgi:predicted DNA-binding ribbon-helix-helix protein